MQRSAFVTQATATGVHPLIKKLESIFPLRGDEGAALEKLPMQVVELRADQDIVREGDRPTRSCLLLEGFACTYKATRDGKRQIMAFHLPGDLPDLQSLHLKTLDNSVGTITPCRVGLIQHDALRELCERHHRIASALWRMTLIDAAVFREWILSIGRRNAFRRIGHLLCELVTRMQAVGLAQGDTCELPMTQEELGDALGISTVHVNRTLQDMRHSGLITLRGGTLTVLDWDGLREASEFAPDYLHLMETKKVN
jgi:CRP-like cAMP-binding protein